MADALGAGSLLVVAGAGFGKTTAIEAAVQSSGLTGAWVRCAEGEDAGTLMARILGALRRAMPGAVDVLGERLVMPGQRVDPRGLAAQVSDTLAELLVDPLALIVDDGEHARPAPAACALLAELLAADGPIRVAVATRTDLPVHAQRLEAAGRLAVFGPADLVFDASECARVLGERRGSEPPPAEVDAVLEATEGWWRFGIWMVVGLFVYFAYSRSHSRLRRGESPVGIDDGPRYTRDPSGAAPSRAPTRADA
jgi:ATP/maltotriose-dependent transcriptional regulator MalT